MYEFDEDQADENQSKQSGKKSGKAPKKSESRLDYLNKLSRGEVSVSDTSDTDASDSDESDNDSESSNSMSDENVIDDTRKRGPLDIPGDQVDVTESNEIIQSNRIAIQNCDWNNLTAEDLM